jgi:hypothetical protein
MKGTDTTSKLMMKTLSCTSAITNNVLQCRTRPDVISSQSVDRQDRCDKHEPPVVNLARMTVSYAHAHTICISHLHIVLALLKLGCSAD